MKTEQNREGRTQHVARETWHGIVFGMVGGSLGVETRAGHRGLWYGTEFLSYFKKSFSGPTELLKNLALEHLFKGQPVTPHLKHGSERKE